MPVRLRGDAGGVTSQTPLFPGGPISAAVRLLSEIEHWWPAADVQTRDKNDEMLVFHAGRLWRLFLMVRTAAAFDAADSARILLRSLAEGVIRTLWLTAPDDTFERELRRRQYL